MTSRGNDRRTLDPSDHFASPQDVLDAADLSRADKIAALTNWANEIRQLQVAEEENMRGATGPAERLQAIERALQALGEEDVGRDAKA